MTDVRRRRRVLGLVSGSTIALAAGCLGGDDSGSGGESGGGGSGGSGVGEETTDVPEDLTAADVLSEDGLSGFVAEFEAGEGEQSLSGTLVVHGDDFYLDEEVSGVERYAIGDSIYVVHGSICEIEDRGDETVDDAYVSADPARGAVLADVPVSHATTVDGEEAYVIELDDLTTMYVDAGTGYRVREEFGPSGVATFHSWGETDPITPPELDCT